MPLQTGQKALCQLEERFQARRLLLEKMNPLEFNNKFNDNGLLRFGPLL
jgi:hypothetical protein